MIIKKEIKIIVTRAERLRFATCGIIQAEKLSRRGRGE